jgi:hypothetical protein
VIAARVDLGGIEVIARPAEEREGSAPGRAPAASVDR